MKKVFLVIIFIKLLFLPSIGESPNNIEKSPYTYYPLYLQQESSWADSVFHSLTLTEKIAQLFMVPAYSKEKYNRKEVKELIEKHEIGGLIFMQGTPRKQITLINEYQRLSKIPLLISMDAEGGLGFRLKNTMSFPSQMTLGAIDDLLLIRDIGKEIARQCKRVGVHVNFSPVADVNNNINNPVINFRSFGERRENVASKASALTLGMQSENIIAVGKHFPGHGDTHVDSHKALPLINFDYKRLDSVELYPFKKLIKNGIGGIMSAHLNVPVLDNKVKVASLSSNIINGLLRKDLGFNGLVFTDALNMKGVADYYEDGDSELQALLAGNDILLFSKDVEKAIKKIQEAIDEGIIKKEEIDEKVIRILKAKEYVKLNEFKPIPLKDLHNDLFNRNFELLNFRAIRNAICIAKNSQNLIPIKSLEKKNILSIGIGADRYTAFQKTLNKYAHVSYKNIPNGASKNVFNKVYNSAKKYDLIIISIHYTLKSDYYGITDEIKSFINDLAKSKKVILTYFGLPYGLSRLDTLKDIESIVVSYDNEKLYQNISAQIIFGGLSAKGKLPVTAHKELAVGTGLNTKQIRIGYSKPELVNLNSNILNSIDYVIKNAINKEAMPGARILIARNSKIIFNRSYGFHTYDRKRPVKESDIYDLASVTKITATLPGIMKLVENKKIKLKDKISKHVPQLKKTNKKSITIKEVLTHQSGLMAFIPFYYYVFDTKAFKGEIVSKHKKSPYTIRVGKRLYVNKKYKFKKNHFSNRKSKKYPLTVGHEVYIMKNYGDSILNKIKDSKLLAKDYRYSDLGFILLQNVLEQVTDTSLNEYVDKNFYQKLGCKTLTFNPLEKFPKNNIVPTSHEPILRKGIIQGTVHDPIAALAGGVSGHAGLFSNAEDLLKMLQMYLNGGNYGGERFLKENTINLFTAKAYRKSSNRRGLGFDKPQMDTSMTSPVTRQVSPFSYGHSGFTGILAWIDPVYDLIYIFQSNRVYPDDWNRKIYELDVRSNIHEIIYKSILDEETSKKIFYENKFRSAFK